jgi:hypothetical protein
MVARLIDRRIKATGGDKQEDVSGLMILSTTKFEGLESVNATRHGQSKKIQVLMIAGPQSDGGNAF